MPQSPQTGSSRVLVHPGPPLLPVALIHVALFGSSLFVRGILAPDAPSPNPFGAPSATVDFFANHGDVARLIAFLQFGSAVPLAIFTATIVSRLQFLGVKAAGPAIALCGGLAAALGLAVTGLWSWMLALPGSVSSSTDRLLFVVPFAAGGPGWGVGFGLLLAGVSVSGGLTGLVPRWLMWFGVSLAAIAELSALTLLTIYAAPSIPITRFVGFVWLVVVALKLPRSTTDPDLRS